MIKGKKLDSRVQIDKPDVNYRKIDALNQSMIGLFDTDPIKFYEEFKLGKRRKQKKSTALMIGDLVDFYLLECEGNDEVFESRFDEKFALFTEAKGTGQVFVLADYLFEITENCTDETGKIICSFDDRFDMACKKIQGDGKYKGKSNEQILEDFLKNGEVYFETLMDNLGKVVVDISLVDKAKRVGQAILTDDFTKDIFTHDPNIEVFPHFPIQWKYKLKDNKYIECKAEVDRLEVDHSKKIIQPDDLKTTYDNESFDIMYVKNSYYLQNAFYTVAVRNWANENGFADYKVLPMRFIVGDTSVNNRRPLVYTTSEKDIEAGLHGFWINGILYRGVHQLIDEIVWCEENGIWNCSRDTFFKKGRLNLNIKYDG